MEKKCANCDSEFVVDDSDLQFLDKISPVIGGKKCDVVAPKMCPACRMQRRMAFRNQSSLYHRNCDAADKNTLSMYREEVSFPVYSPDEWWGSKWEAKDFGVDFDFNRPFFEQFIELRDTVPHLALVSQANINCDYCNVVGHSKSCYLIYGSIECEDCYYGNPYSCRQCVDSFLLRNSEICLECVDSNKLYDCSFCQNCSNSSGLKFCFDINNSQDCFACAGLNHKQYCILNKQYVKEEYENILSDIDLTNETQFSKVMSQFNDLKQGVPHRYYVGTNNEKVSGDYVFNSKDCKEIYGAEECQDVSYSFQLLKVNDSMDLTVGECGELLYEVSAFYDRVTNVILSYFCWGNVHDLIYCGQCTRNVNNCFGCVGLKNAEYCILNKQYTKEEYEEMVPKIIEHMKDTGEWGEFFPMSVSPFAYNETIASEFFPMEKENVLKRGWDWFDDAGLQGDVPGDARVCEVTGALFRVIPGEQKIYEHFKVRLPNRSPNQRHRDRIALRNPMKLYERVCDKCSVDVQTTYSSEGKEKIYCEECYLKEVY